MTRSTGTREHAVELVDEMLTQLDEDLLLRTIDEPIDQAAGSFQLDGQGPAGHHRFHRILAQFVRHLYRHGLAGPRFLSLSQAHDEAISLLEHAYQGTHSRGYDAACLEACGGDQDAIDDVLGRLTEALKAARRRIHTRAVFLRCVDLADWPLKCQIASILIQKYQDCLPPFMQGRAASEFADEIPQLLDAAVDMAQLLRPLRTRPTVSALGNGMSA